MIIYNTRISLPLSDYPAGCYIAYIKLQTPIYYVQQTIHITNKKNLNPDFHLNYLGENLI